MGTITKERPTPKESPPSELALLKDTLLLTIEERLSTLR